MVTRGKISRLPKVTCTDAVRPFVIMTRHPNNATSISSLGRTLNGSFIEGHSATVTAYFDSDIDILSANIGVFGYYNALVLKFGSSLSAKPRVMAQDLKGVSQAQDISGEVLWHLTNASVIIKGETIQRIGTSDKSRVDDVSKPGLVIGFFPE